MRKVISNMAHNEILVSLASPENLYVTTNQMNVYLLTRRSHISINSVGEETDQGPYFWLSLKQGTTRGNAWGPDEKNFRAALRTALRCGRTVWAFDNYVEFGKWLSEETLC